MNALDEDLARFSAEHHKHLTVLEAVVVEVNRGILRGWRLWCMNCHLRGQHLFTGSNAGELAKQTADSLRSDSVPQCKHRQYAEEDSP